jgi:hypothetical protein
MPSESLMVKTWQPWYVTVDDNRGFEKRCHGRCKEVKLLTDFSRDKSSRDGRKGVCKACKDIYRHTEKGKEVIRRYNNSEKGRETHRAVGRRFAKTPKRKAYAKIYAKTPQRKAVIAKANAKYFQSPKAKETHSRYVATKEAKRLRSKREATDQYKQKHAVRQSRRRAHKRHVPINDFTAAQWKEMQAIYDHRCVYCGKRAKGHLTQDHLTPLSKGGSHTAINILPACRRCNSQKRAGAVLRPVQPLLLTIAPQKPRRSRGDSKHI